jgi:hypothetical protein
LKLNDIITPDQLRERMFGDYGPVESQKRFERAFEQVQPFADMISLECTKRRVLKEIGGAWINFLVCLTDHLQDEEKRIA